MASTNNIFSVLTFFFKHALLANVRLFSIRARVHEVVPIIF